MVECEFRDEIIFDFANQVLIDTWWNVNRVKAKVFEEGKPVLIDTWWNVNTEKKLSSLETIEVLIDTWWNVNVELCKYYHPKQMF